MFFVIFIFTLGTANAQQAEEACHSDIMSVSGKDFSKISPNTILESCQDMPLSEDLSIQVLSILIGEPILLALDVFTVISGNEHGMDENASLMTVSKPLHDVLGVFNKFMLGVFILFTLIGLSDQLIQWQRGNTKVDFKQIFNKNGASKGLVAFLATPMIGWMTPLQFVALGFIIWVGYITKIVVSYLFLASFLGDALSETKKEVLLDVKLEMGYSVLLHKCDLQQREYLLSSIQQKEGAKERTVIESNPLYTCLASSDVLSPIVNLSKKTAEALIFDVIPANIAQTNLCVDRHRLDIEEWGFVAPQKCGVIKITLPNNVNAPGSIDNVKSLYFNPEIIKAQREMALSLHEFSCRKAESLIDWALGVAEKCIIATTNGSGYNYQWYVDDMTGESNFLPYRSPLTEVSSDQLKTKMKQEMSALSSRITNNVAGLLAHVGDLIAPLPDENTQSQEMQDTLASLRKELLERAQTTSALGYDSKDVDFLVDNMKRGAWTSGSLFFGKLAYGIEKKALADALESVYTVPDINMGGIFNTYDEYTQLSTLLAMTLNNDLTGIATDIISDTLLPRVGLYTDNLNCWYKQLDCKTPPLNPFTYLGKRGAKMIDHGLIGYTASVLINMGAKKMLSPSKRGGLMLATTFSEIYLLYILIGVVLAIIIPAMPLLKLMTMLVNWSYDIVRELLGIQITLCMSALGKQGDKFLGDDVRDALSRLFGLGIYFMFVVMGLISMFLMFSFLFSLNVLVVGSLSYIVDWTSSTSSIESMVMLTIYDVLITFILFYEVKICTPYIEKFPKALSENFGITVSNSSGVAEQAIQRLTTSLRTNVAGMLTSVMNK
jgi:hypothetical protein